jgi:hypothetical protein
MNDESPIYPRNGLSPKDWTGIYCQRPIPKSEPARVCNFWGYLLITVDQEVCRGEIVGRTGEERCSFCGARPVWA